MRYKLPSLAALFLLAGSGCAEDTAELFVAFNALPDNECRVTAGDSTELFNASGTLDLLVTRSYEIYPIVESTLVPSEGVSFARAGGQGGLTGADWEANSVSITAVDVEFDVPKAFGVGIPKKLTIPLSGSIEPGGSAAFAFRAIPATLGDVLAASKLLRTATAVEDPNELTIGLRLKFRGMTGGGREVDSNEFKYPLTVCYGCSLSYSADADSDPTDARLDCLNFNSDQEIPEESFNKCAIGQDSITDCRLVCGIPSNFASAEEQAIFCGTP
jgi:hypothetical protein